MVLTVGQRLMPAEHYRLEVADPPLSRDVRPAAWALLLTVFLSSALINNFVFTRYLGLCIFFGVSKKRDTAIGMGITFTAVMIFTAMVSWAVDTYVLRPLHLGFLQILVFIGTVAVRRAVPRHHAQEDAPGAAQRVRRLPDADHHQLHHPRGAAAQRAASPARSRRSRWRSARARASRWRCS